ncbi:hypothetical protein CAEBREN_05314 [Caenorhabditis brenneri]|uniref:SXP/RAL-2 family protein Ani s 5-like cation-binding domain-containing protein n=1 Tax=Caenorhabditis brenneri TaxID=135651 RepID=G0PKV7_CAEBE|nr:hypothetical protein CAEBREN_05314 [Caenorhabditis brenneri]
MRNLIFVAVLATSVSSLSFLEKAQGYLSGNASASGSASSSSSSASNFFAGLQNSSFGQTIMNGYNDYKQAKNGNGSSNWQTAFSNSSIGAAIQQSLNGSSLGAAVNSGIEFYHNMTNGGSPFDSDASSIIGSFVPFLANTSSEARAEFYAILPNVGNMTIAEFENAVNQWAAKYNLTEEVEAFNQRSQNATIAAEEHANSVIMNLPNVLTNLKAISSNKDQTAVQMHTSMMNYVESLDDDTQEIVFIFFKNLLPPQFKKPKCNGGGNFLADIYQKAAEYFGGQNSTSGGSKQGSGNGMGFGSVGPFWNSFSGNGNGNSGSGNEKPHPMIGVISNFFNKNNISDQQAGSAMNGVQHDGGFASIQILPAASLNIGDGSLASDAQIDLAVVDPIQTQTTKKNKKQQQQANKNKKKTTTVAPVDANANLAVEVHAQVL